MKDRYVLREDCKNDFSLPIKDTYHKMKPMWITDVIKTLNELVRENEELKGAIVSEFRLCPVVSRFKLDEDGDLQDTETGKYYLCDDPFEKRWEFIENLNRLYAEKEYWKGRCKTVERIKRIDVEVEVDEGD